MPYKTVRATFNPVSGYPVGPGAEQAKEQFSDRRWRSRPRGSECGRTSMVKSASTRRSTSCSGDTPDSLWYFPAAIGAPSGGAATPATPLPWSILLSVGALAVFYLVWMPMNYFGGAAFIGNRYFVTGYVALLFLPARGLSRKALLAVWALGFVVFGSACTSVLRTRHLDSSSQNHAYAGLFRLLPYESTAMNIAGRRDLYWEVEFFRFVDPYAIVDSAGFTLLANEPAAEILHASKRDTLVARFLARSDSGSARILYRGAGGARSFELEPVESGSRGLLEIELESSKLRHRYWFQPPERMHTRKHRFWFEEIEPSASGVERSAELYYLGSTRLVPKFYRGVLMAGSLPVEGRAGGRTAVPLRFRNTGYRFWSASDTVPTQVGYRIFALPRAEGDRAIRSRLHDFEGRIPRASEIDVALDVRWPREPGEYELVVDLKLGGAIWFEEWNREPLARAVVRVDPATAGLQP